MTDEASQVGRCKAVPTWGEGVRTEAEGVLEGRLAGKHSKRICRVQDGKWRGHCRRTWKGE